MRIKISREQIKAVAFGSLGIASMLVAWQVIVTFSTIGKIFPAPLEVFVSFFKSIYTPIGKYTLVNHVIFSLFRVVVGYSLSAICGVFVGLLMGSSKKAMAIINPIFNIIKPIPGIAWIPLAILWFGIDEQTIYFIIFMGGFSQVVLNTMSGALRVKQDLIGVAKVLGASNRQVFYKIVLPSSVPYIFAGLQVSLSTSWMAVLAAEMVSATEGVGWIIVVGMQTGNTLFIVVGMVSIGMVGLVLAGLMRSAERGLCSWSIRGK